MQKISWKKFFILLSFWDTAVCLHFWVKFKMATRGPKRVTSQVFWSFLLPWVLQSHKVSSKLDQKQNFFINRTFFVNKQLTLFFNFLQNHSLNFAQNFRECSFNLAGSESVEKSKWPQLFAYISQLFVYKTRLWT